MHLRPVPTRTWEAKCREDRKTILRPTRAGTVPAAGLCLASPPSPFCEWGLPLPKIAQKPVAPTEWGDGMPSLGWLVGFECPSLPVNAPWIERD